MSGFSLALSGGGVLGLAHIPLFEVLDEFGARPERIAGTSMGAVLGAPYAAGLEGRAIREHVLGLLDNPLGPLWVYLRGALHGTPGQGMSVEAMLELGIPPGLPENIEELPTPFVAVATDFFDQTIRLFERGPLLVAVAASAAVPGVFRPVVVDGRVMVDGGVVNNLPHDILGDVPVVASDALGVANHMNGGMPGRFEIIAGSLRIMMRALVEERLARHPPALLISAGERKVMVLEFHKGREVLAEADARKDEMRRKIGVFLERL